LAMNNGEREGLLDEENGGAVRRISDENADGSSTSRRRRTRGGGSTTGEDDNLLQTILTFILTFTLVVVLVGLLTGAWWVQTREHRPYIVWLLLSSIVPSVMLLYFAYYWKNRDCAPVPLVIGSYLAGIFMALPVALVEAIVTESAFPERPKNGVVTADRNTVKIVLQVFAVAFICVACVEEGGKILYTYYRARQSGRYLTPYGIVIVGLACSLGFASLENAAYIFRPTSRVSDAFEIAFARALMSTPLHGTCGVLIGIGIAKRLRRGQKGHWCGAMFYSVLIHGLYDVVLMLPEALKYIPESHHNILERVGMAISSLTVVFATFLAYESGKELLLNTRSDRPELPAPKWPSGEAFEHASGCS
jgi:protease PrsW